MVPLDKEAAKLAPFNLGGDPSPMTKPDRLPEQWPPNIFFDWARGARMIAQFGGYAAISHSFESVQASTPVSMACASTPEEDMYRDRLSRLGIETGPSESFRVH